MLPTEPSYTAEQGEVISGPFLLPCVSSSCRDGLTQQLCHIVTDGDCSQGLPSREVTGTFPCFFPAEVSAQILLREQLKDKQIIKFNMRKK